MIKAVIFDIYGTLLKQDVGDLSDSLQRKAQLIKSFEKISRLFDLNCDAKSIYDIFVSEIDKEHKRKQKKGISYPEVRIEQIWKRILKKLGHDISDEQLFYDIALKHQEVFAKRTLYPNTVELLAWLDQQEYIKGIISNAQFYTKVDMLKILMKKFDITSLDDVFDPELSVYSYEVGFSKPNPESFKIIKRELKKRGINAKETLYVGNDIFNDVYAASKQGLKTCLFINPETKYRKDKYLNVKPDYKVKDILDIKKIIRKEEIEYFKNRFSDHPYTETKFKGSIIPVLEKLRLWHQPDKTTIIGIQGGQGSGKTTYAEFLAEFLSKCGYRCSSFSIDDFYKSAKEREKMSKIFINNPYYQISRGLPGTHRTRELEKVLKSIKAGKETIVPVFDKSKKDGYGDISRKKNKIEKRQDFVFFEGYCIGAPYTDIKIVKKACENNGIDLKEIDDSKGFEHTKKMLSFLKDYQKSWVLIDHYLMLKTTANMQVSWRKQQEDDLKKKKKHGMKESKIKDFVMHFIPITMLCYEAIDPDILVQVGKDHKFNNKII